MKFYKIMYASSRSNNELVYVRFLGWFPGGVPTHRALFYVRPAQQIVVTVNQMYSQMRMKKEQTSLHAVKQSIQADFSNMCVLAPVDQGHTELTVTRHRLKEQSKHYLHTGD